MKVAIWAGALADKCPYWRIKPEGLGGQDGDGAEWGLKHHSSGAPARSRCT